MYFKKGYIGNSKKNKNSYYFNGVHKNEEFFSLQHTKIHSIIFFDYKNSERDYTCSFTLQRRLKNFTTTIYFDIIKNVYASFVDSTFHVYINKFLSSYSVSYGLVHKALVKSRHSRSVWGSLLHTSPSLCNILHTKGGKSPNAQFLKRMIPAVETLSGTDSRWPLSLLWVYQCICLWIFFCFVSVEVEGLNF